MCIRDRDGEGELLEVAMGPHHPSTHGVFRMDLALDGERVIRLKPVFGYLHRNHEKIAEGVSYLSSMPYTDRLEMCIRDRVYSPAKPNAIKNAIYECGLESRGDAWVQFRSAYYLYAIIFLIFDVEAVFLLPFAVAFTGLGLAACVAMVVFVLLLIEGLAWAWVKGVLTWA